MAKRTVTYWAKSMWVSKTAIVNLLVVIAEGFTLTEVAILIPPHWQPRVVAFLAVVNIVLRRLTVRPARFRTLPGESDPVVVKKVDPGASDRIAPELLAKERHG